MMNTASSFPDWHGTTILAVRRNGRTVIAGDGQVSMGPTIVKGAARKVRVLAGGRVLAALQQRLAEVTVGDMTEAQAREALFAEAMQRAADNAMKG